MVITFTLNDQKFWIKILEYILYTKIYVKSLLLKDAFKSSF